MTLNEVLSGATEGTRIRCGNMSKGVFWTVSARGVLVICDSDSASCMTVDNARATDWERLPTEVEIAALERAMLDAAQAVMEMRERSGLAMTGTKSWEQARAAYFAAKEAV